MNTRYRPFRPRALTLRLVGSLALAGLLAGKQAGAWTPLDQTETWSAPGTGGWTNTTAGVTLTNPASRLEFVFAPQFTPQFVGGVAWHPVDAGTKLTNLAFRIDASNIPPSRIELCLHSRLTGSTWYYTLPVPAPGGVIDCNVPVSYNAGWRKGPLSTPESFTDDIRTLDSVGIYMRRSGDPVAQRYGLDDFRLQGQSWPEDKDLDGMESDWESLFGLLPDDPRDALVDMDGDGVSNFAEARAGTDPTNRASRFTIHTEMETGGGGSQKMKVWWNSISNRTYTVWKTTDLRVPFEPAEIGMPSAMGTNVYEETSGAGSPTLFYKVAIDP